VFIFWHISPKNLTKLKVLKASWVVTAVSVFCDICVCLHRLIVRILLQADLINMTWHEVQRKLLEAQKELQMCIHKAELTELGLNKPAVFVSTYRAVIHICYLILTVNSIQYFASFHVIFGLVF